MLCWTESLDLGSQELGEVSVSEGYEVLSVPLMSGI